MEYKNNMFYIYNKRENIISCIKGKSKFVEWLNKKADNFTYQFFTTLKEFEKWEKTTVRGAWKNGKQIRDFKKIN